MSVSDWPWSEEVDSELYRKREEWPKISIITPSYNQGQYIEKTILSVLNQNYPNLEYIVIDGGSTDNTLTIINKYDKNIDFWVSEKDGGQSEAINKGFAHASGEIFGWLNSDDYLLNGALYEIGKCFVANPGIIAYVGECDKVDIQGNLLEKVIPRNLDADSLADWSGKGFFYQPACYFNAEAYKKVGGVDERLHFAMDVDLWIKLAEIGDFKIIDKTLAVAHIYEDMKTLRDIAGRDVETAAVAVMHGKMPQAKKRIDSYVDYCLDRGLEDYRIWNACKSRIKRKIKKLLNRS